MIWGFSYPEHLSAREIKFIPFFPLNKGRVHKVLKRYYIDLLVSQKANGASHTHLLEHY